MYSIEHKEFLLNIKRRKYIIRTIQVAILIGFIFLWQILSDKNIINSFIASSPKKIIQTITELYKNKNLFHHIFITVYETGISFLLGTFIGIIIAIILWWSAFLSKVLDPYLVVLNSLPKVVLRSNYYHMGWCRNASDCNNGNFNFSNCYDIRKFKRLFKDR